MKLLNAYAWRKTIPQELQVPVLLALKHYPELQHKKITIKYTRKEGTSIMKAQPELSSILQPGNDRSYIIYTNKTLTLGGKKTPIAELPEEVLSGWFGHELGHVMDYETLSVWGLIRFGFRYLTSSEFIKRAEQRADEIAVEHNMGPQIIATKNFILTNADLPESYKQKIRKLYPSPEQIMEVVNGEKDLSVIQ